MDLHNEGVKADLYELTKRRNNLLAEIERKQATIKRLEFRIRHKEKEL